MALEQARPDRRPAGFNKIATRPQPPSLTLVSSAPGGPAPATTRKPSERGSAMYVHYPLAKAHQDELLRTRARDPPPAPGRPARPPPPPPRNGRPPPPPAAMRLRRLFS